MEGDRQLAPGGRLSRRDYQREQYLKRKAVALEVASSKQLEEAAAAAAGVRAYDRQRYLKRKAQKQVSDVSCASKESPLGIICEPAVAGHAGVSCADPVVAPPIGGYCLILLLDMDSTQKKSPITVRGSVTELPALHITCDLVVS